MTAETDNREVMGDKDKRIFRGALRTRQKKSRSEDTSEFLAGRNHPSNLTSTLPITVASMLRTRGPPATEPYPAPPPHVSERPDPAPSHLPESSGSGAQTSLQLFLWPAGSQGHCQGPTGQARRPGLTLLRSELVQLLKIFGPCGIATWEILILPIFPLSAFPDAISQPAPVLPPWALAACSPGRIKMVSQMPFQRA